MKLKAKYLGLETGGRPIVTLSKDDASELGLFGGERVKIELNSHFTIAIVNVVVKSVQKGLIGLSDDAWEKLKPKEGSMIEVSVTGSPESLHAIRDKLQGKKLTHDDMLKIVKDAAEGDLTETEIAAFVTALHAYGGPSMDEAYSLSTAMVETGSKLEIGRKPICDKHSIGGVPGDKTTMLVVPVVAAAGLVIPKTSSRAITSAAGTADRVETLMPVDLSIEDMKRVVEKTNGCMVWGGALDMAPADDVFIRAEFPLSIDPLLLPSIMSKKKAAGAQYLVIDIPTGRGTKMKTISDSDALGKEFIELGKKMGINTQCVLTYGEQPLGHCVGAGLEAREALEVITNAKRVPDVLDKVSHIAGTLLEMTGIQNGRETALELIKSGKAEKKMREIIYEQGGDSEVRPEDVEIGQYGAEVKSDKSGMVLWIDNVVLVAAARAAGSPKNKKSGVVINKKIGDPVKKGDVLFTIYSDKATKLSEAEKIANAGKVYGVADRREMMIHRLHEVPARRQRFMIDR